MHIDKCVRIVVIRHLMEIVTSVKFNDNEKSSPNSFDYDIGILRQFSEKYDLKLHVYSKNPNMPLDAPENIIIDEPKYRLIEIPDIGRCDYAFIYHIVRNYDSLPEHLYFTKSNINDRILLDDVNHILFDYKYHFLNIGLHVKLQVYGDAPDFTGLPPLYPEDIENHCLSYKKNFECGTVRAYGFMDFFEMVFGCENKPPNTMVGVGFGHGPCFRVSRELILRHPKTVYEKLLDTFYPNRGHWDAAPDISIEEQLDTIGKLYHDSLLRFWTLLFTYGTILEYETNFTTMVGFLL